MVSVTKTPSSLCIEACLRQAWPLTVGLIVYLALVTRRTLLLQDPGTYWHIAVGRIIIEQHIIPIHDPFSYTKSGTLWSSHEWASEVLTAIVYSTFGWPGLIFLTAFCGASAFVLFAEALLRSLEPRWVLVGVILAVPMAVPHVLARPHSFALPLMVLWVAELAQARDEERPPSYWLLPIMLLWANCHGGYTIGLLIAAMFAGEAVITTSPPLRRTAFLQWAKFGALALFASMLTADGPSGLLFTVDTVGSRTTMAWIQEWGPLNFQYFQPMEMWLFGLIFLGLTLGVRLPCTRIAMLLVLIHLGLAHVRFVEVVALLGPLIIAGSLGAELGRLDYAAAPRLRTPSGAATKSLPAIGIAMLAVTSLAITAALFERRLDRSDDSVTPTSALAAVEKFGPCANMLNHMRFGGYLIFRGIRTFIDDRTTMYGDEFLSAYIDATLAKVGTLPDLLRRYDIGWTLFGPDDIVIGSLDRLPGWQRIYADRSAVVHVRTDAGHGCVQSWFGQPRPTK